MSFIDFSDYDANSAVVTVRRERGLLALGIAAGSGVAVNARDRTVSAEGNTLVSGTVDAAKPNRQVRALALEAGDGAVLAARPARHVSATLVTGQPGTVSMAHPPRVVRVTGYADGDPGEPDQPNAGVAFLTRPARHVYAEDTVVPPTPGYVSMMRPARAITAQSVTVYDAKVTIHRDPQVTVVGYADGQPGAPDQPNAGVVLMERPTRSVYATVWAPGDRTGALQTNYPVFIGTLSDEVVMGLSDSLTLADAPQATWIQVLNDAMRLADAPDTLLDAIARLTDGMDFADLVGITYRMLIAETVALGGTPTASLRHALMLADALALAGGPGTSLNAQVALAQAFALADAQASVYPSALADTVAFEAAAETTWRASMQLMDAMRIAGTPALSVTWLAVHDDTLDLADAASSTANLRALLADGMALMGTITLDDGTYQAWVVNTESQAFVQYRNFPFNSFARLGDRYFGVAPDGLYELAGDDDAGEPIEAVLRGGLADMGTSRLKRMPSMYVGYTADDVMLLKVTVNSEGDDAVRQEYWYQMEPRSGALRVNRAKLGRGLVSTYWGWELNNVDGAAFALDSIAWYPVVLDRRLN